MIEAVLDASAVLALIKEEPGAEKVADVASRSTISTVNVSEAVAKLVEKGAAPDEAKGIVFSLPMRIAEFDAHQAALAGMMWARGKRAGQSFG
ncbi:MAG: PIN domain-containing protein, partial [Parvibaculaceae bacterium]